jgi:8-oxo-dGTP diphosphatase
MKVTAALIPLQGRLFVGQRPPWKKFGLLWEFPGGKVEPGESLEQSLIREIKEELCLDITVLGLFQKIRQEEQDFGIDLHAYWCGISGGRLCLSAHVDFMWADLPELKRMNFTRADRLLIPFLEDVPVFPELSGDWEYFA